MNFGDIVNFIKENKLEDCGFITMNPNGFLSDGFDMVLYSDPDMKIRSYVAKGDKVYHQLELFLHEDGWTLIACINTDAVFKIRNNIIPDDIKNLIDIARDEYTKPDSEYHGEIFDGDEYLDESSDNGDGIPLTGLLEYRYYNQTKLLSFIIERSKLSEDNGTYHNEKDGISIDIKGNTLVLTDLTTESSNDYSINKLMSRCRGVFWVLNRQVMISII